MGRYGAILQGGDLTLWESCRVLIAYNLRVYLRSLLPTIEVNGKRYLEGGRLGVVQEEAADVAAAVAASSSAEEGEAMCNIM